MQDFQFPLATRDRRTLFGRGWQAEQDPRAIVALVHGMGEHSGRYDQLARQLVAAGLAVLAYDQRGHGRNPGKRGDAASYDLLLDDVAALVTQARQQFGDRPVFLYGQSFGGCLVINFALRRQPDIRGLIATSPLFRTALEPPPWKLRIARLLVRLKPTLTMSTRIDPRGLSHDASVVEAYTADPLVHSRVSLRWGRAMLAAGPWALEHASELSLPLLLMHGTADPITCCQASREFAASAPTCTLKTWDDLLHELHHETNRQEVLDTVVRWIDDQLPA